MAKPVIQTNTPVLFRAGGKLMIGKVTGTYVKNRRRLYSVLAESGNAYSDLPADSTTSPNYMIDSRLSRSFFKEQLTLIDDLVDGADSSEE